MQFIPNYFEHEDGRGRIIGIINKGVWREFNLVTTNAGATRGGHYHKETREIISIIQGDVHVEIQKIVNGEKNAPLSFSAHKGDTFCIRPYTLHKLTAITSSTWINVLDKPHNADTPDMWTA